LKGSFWLCTHPCFLCHILYLLWNHERTIPPFPFFTQWWPFKGHNLTMLHRVNILLMNLEILIWLLYRYYVIKWCVIRIDISEYHDTPAVSWYGYTCTCIDIWLHDHENMILQFSGVAGLFTCFLTFYITVQWYTKQ